MQNALIVFAALIAFGVIHSLTAGFHLRERLKPLLGERFVAGWYRLAYNVFSVITFLPVLVLVAVLPSDTLYTVGPPWAFLLIGIQLIGVVGLAISLFTIDLGRFLGLSQVIAYLNGEPLPLPEEPLVTSGIYRLTRHPLYFFAMLFIWPSPVMTTTVLAFNLGVTAYFLIGSRLEERRLLRAFGEEYARYRKRVSWIIPLPSRGNAAR